MCEPFDGPFSISPICRCAVEERVAIADRFAAPCVGLHPSVVTLAASFSDSCQSDLASVLVHIAYVGRSVASVQEHLPSVAATEMSVVESGAVAPSGSRCYLSLMVDSLYSMLMAAEPHSLRSGLDSKRQKPDCRRSR